MIKHFSPRAWLNSIYTDDNTKKGLFEKEDRKPGAESVSKRIKGLIGDKEKGKDKGKTIENRSTKNLRRVEQKDDKRVFKTNNGKVSEGLFNKIEKDKKAFA